MRSSATGRSCGPAMTVRSAIAGASLSRLSTCAAADLRVRVRRSAIAPPPMPSAASNAAIQPQTSPLLSPVGVATASGCIGDSAAGARGAAATGSPMLSIGAGPLPTGAGTASVAVGGATGTGAVRTGALAGARVARGAGASGTPTMAGGAIEVTGTPLAPLGATGIAIGRGSPGIDVAGGVAAVGACGEATCGWGAVTGGGTVAPGCCSGAGSGITGACAGISCARSGVAVRARTAAIAALAGRMWCDVCVIVKCQRADTAKPFAASGVNPGRPLARAVEAKN